MSELIARLLRRTNDRRMNWHPSTIEIVLLTLAVALALRAYTFSTAGLDWDESLYIVMAQRWLHGGLPYVAVWDQHPVGVPAIFAVATWLVGDGLLAARFACLVAVVATAALLARFLMQYAGDTRAGVLAGAFYLFFMSRPEGLAANTEVFNNCAVTAASFLLLGETLRGGRVVRDHVVFAAGLLFGIGLQIKYVVIPEATLLCSTSLFLSWRGSTGTGRILRMMCFMVAGGLLPTAVATFYFWQTGVLRAYLQANVGSNVAYLDLPIPAGTILLRLRYGLLPIVSLLPWIVALPWLRLGRAAPGRSGTVVSWLTIWLIAAAIDVMLPMKFWKHYFEAVLPPLCLVTGLGVVHLAGRFGPWRRWSLGLLIGMVLLPAVGLMAKHFSDSRTIARTNVPLMIADQIERGGTNRHDIYVMNYDPLVYAYADAWPPTPFVLGIELSEFGNSSGARSTAVIRRILHSRPHWIIVADPSPYAFTPQIWQMLDATLQDYRLVGSYHEADYIQPPITVRLYQYNGDEAPSQADHDRSHLGVQTVGKHTVHREMKTAAG